MYALTEGCNKEKQHQTIFLANRNQILEFLLISNKNNINYYLSGMQISMVVITLHHSIKLIEVIICFSKTYYLLFQWVSNKIIIKLLFTKANRITIIYMRILIVNRPSSLFMKN